MITGAIKPNTLEKVVRPLFCNEFYLERTIAKQFMTAAETHVTRMLVIQDSYKNVHLLVKVLSNSTSIYIDGPSLKQVSCQISDTLRFGIQSYGGGDAVTLQKAIRAPNTSFQTPTKNGKAVEKLFAFSDHNFVVALVVASSHQNSRIN